MLHSSLGYGLYFHGYYMPHVSYANSQQPLRRPIPVRPIVTDSESMSFPPPSLSLYPFLRLPESADSPLDLTTGNKAPHNAVPENTTVSFPVKREKGVTEIGDTVSKPHICVQCGKGFKIKATLKAHLRTHTGEKPYPCPICPKSFADYSTRRKHIRLHTGEKPYVCTECGKGFAQSGNMIRHRLIHKQKG